MSLDLFFQVLLSFSLFLLSSDDLCCFVKHFSLSGSSVWKLNKIFAFSFLSFGSVCCEVFKLFRTLQRVIVGVNILPIGVVAFFPFFCLLELMQSIFYFFLSLIVINLVIFNFFIFHNLIIILKLIVVVIVLVDHLLVWASLAFTFAFPAIFVALHVEHLLLSPFRAIDPEVGDVDGFVSGEICLELSVVYLFEVEPDINGNSAGHCNQLLQTA